MDARPLADALDAAAAQVAEVAAELAVAGARVGRAAMQASWTGAGADAALRALAVDVAAVAACAGVADRVASMLRRAADEARAVADVASRL